MSKFQFMFKHLDMWQLLLFFITTGANVGQFQRFYKAQEFYTTLRDPVPAQLITQKVDHFCGTCTETFQQRFFVNDTFYKPGGPVFLCVGGEGPALTGWSVVSSVHCNVAVEYASQVSGSVSYVCVTLSFSSNCVLKEGKVSVKM